MGFGDNLELAIRACSGLHAASEAGARGSIAAVFLRKPCSPLLAKSGQVRADGSWSAL